jgi:general secretion pathway protein C
MNTTDWINRILVLLQAMLIAGAVFFGVKAGYRMLLGELAPCVISRAPERESQKNTAAIHPFSEYAVISRRNLFGAQEPSDRQRISSDIERLRQTRLKLKLRGTISGSEDTARAVVEDASGKGQFLVKVGDAIQDAVVIMILKGKIVLQVSGRDELLEMDQWTSGPSASLPSGSSMTPAQIDDRQQVISVKRSQIDDALKDINQLMKQVRIIPNFNQGKPDGLTISGIPQDSFFSQIGLRSGDILSGVDGKAIESVDDALKLYTGMKSASRLKLQLKRGGKDEVIDYAID